MGLSISTVYVRLLNEGTNVLRPTNATKAINGQFTLLAVPDYDMSDETWEFLPGDTVICELRCINGSSHLVAARKVI